MICGFVNLFMMKTYRNENKGCLYNLNVKDIFSKFAWQNQLKNKMEKCIKTLKN